MRLFLHLLAAERRTVRTTALGAAGAAGLLAFGACVWIGTREHVSADALRGPVRAAVAVGSWLTGSAVAAESFAQDVATRRVASTVLLPVGLPSIARAKLAATGIAAVVGAFVPAVAALLALAAVPASGLVGPVLPEIVRGAVFAAGALGVVALTALLALVLEQGLGAVVGAGLLAVLAVVTGHRVLPAAEWGLGEAELVVAGITLAVLAAWATQAAFVRGPVHLDRRWRRAAIGAAALAAAAVPAGIAGAAVLDRRADIAPGDADAVAAGLRVSPDGSRAVVFLGTSNAPETCTAWILDLRTGARVRVDGRSRTFHAWDPASEAGAVASRDGHAEGLRLLRRNLRHPREAPVVDTIDPATGHVVATRSTDEDAAAARLHAGLRTRSTGGGVLVERIADGARWRFDGVRVALPSPDGSRVAFVSASGDVGVAAVPPTGETAGPALRADSAAPGVSWSGLAGVTAIVWDPAGGHVLASHGVSADRAASPATGLHRVVVSSASSGVTVAAHPVPLPSGAVLWCPADGRPDRAIVQMSDGAWCEARIADGSLVGMPWTGHPARHALLPGGGVLRVDASGEPIVGADGPRSAPR